MNRISLFNLMKNQTVLSGALLGRQALSALVSETLSATEPSVQYIDMKGIDVATISFLRESVVAFRDFSRNRDTSVYPVYANLSDDVSEELDFYLKERGDALAVCDLDETGAVSNCRLLGRLDEKQLLTFEAIVRLNEATAKALAEDGIEQDVKMTAWNNRLAALTSKGLLIEKRQGRTKAFKPVLECFHNGH